MEPGYFFRLPSGRHNLIGYVWVNRTVSSLTASSCSPPDTGMMGGPAPVRRSLLQLHGFWLCYAQDQPGLSSTSHSRWQTSPKERSAMDERRAIKMLLRVLAPRHYKCGQGDEPKRIAWRRRSHLDPALFPRGMAGTDRAQANPRCRRLAVDAEVYARAYIWARSLALGTSWRCSIGPER